MTEQRKFRSVSQINQYERCPYSYYLSRIKKAWKRPAAWLAQGSAVHEAMELWERSNRTLSLEEVREIFKQVYERLINESLAITPNMEFWFASGPHRGEADIIRRFDIGLEQVDKCIDWHLKHPEQVIWIAPDGTPGIELNFEIELDGIPIRGFIDAVRKVNGEPRVVDYKTGNSPGEDFQLGVYGVALAEMFGIEPPALGEYFMAGKKGVSAKPTYPYPIKAWTRDRVSEKFRELEDNIAAGRFDPLPEPSKCRFCDVAVACEFSC